MKKIISALVLALLVPSLAFANFDRNVKYGTRNSDDVREVQEFLTDQGVYNGPITGNFYSLTLRGVKNFQSKQGLKVTGFWGQAERDAANKLTDTSESDQLSSTTPLSLGFMDGSYFDSAGNPVRLAAPVTPVIIVTPTTTPATNDVCSNIEGVQTAVPIGMVYDSGKCVTQSVSQPAFSAPSVSQPLTSQPSTPALLPAYTEAELVKVLGCQYNQLPKPDPSPTNFTIWGPACNTALEASKRLSIVFNEQTVLQNGKVVSPPSQTPGYIDLNGLTLEPTYPYRFVYTEPGRQDTVIQKTFKATLNPAYTPLELLNKLQLVSGYYNSDWSWTGLDLTGKGPVKMATTTTGLSFQLVGDPATWGKLKFYNDVVLDKNGPTSSNLDYPNFDPNFHYDCEYTYTEPNRVDTVLRVWCKGTNVLWNKLR